MHLTQSLVNGTLADAAKALADRAVAIRHGAPRFSKEALDKTAFLQNLDPTSRSALLGAGVGGALGLGSSMLKDPKERRTGSSMLTGALAGGAVGLGLGMASSNSPSKALAAKTDAQGRPALPAGQFYDPSTGKPMTLSKDLPPEIAAKMTNLEEAANGSTLAGKALSTSYQGARSLVTGMPVTIAGASAVAAKNALMSPNKSVDPTWPSWRSRVLGKGSWFVPASESRNVSHLAAGISGLKKEDLANLNITPDQHAALGELVKHKGGATLRDVATKGTPWSVRIKNVDAGTNNRVKLDENLLGPLRANGAAAEIPKVLREAGKLTPVLRTSLFNRITNRGPKHINVSTPGGVARTAAKYLGGAAVLGLLERGSYDYLNQRSSKNQVQKMLEQYAKPVQ